MFDKYVCPECNGAGVYIPDNDDGSNASRCYYCNGIGFATDEDVEERFHYYEDI